MTVQASRSIGRRGGDDDEPPFDPPTFPSVADQATDSPTNSPKPLSRAGGDDDEPAPSPNAFPATATVTPDATFPLRPSMTDLTDAQTEETAGGNWCMAAAGIVFSAILVWLFLQVANLIATTLALPLVFRVPALAVEVAAVMVVGFWIIRIAGLFIGFRKRSYKDMPAYYRRLSTSPVFVREFPVEKRENVLNALGELAYVKPEMTKAWNETAKAFELDRREVAEGIVRKHALLTAVKTATSPWKIIDVIAVFYNSTRMVERLARFYGQRCTGAQAFRLVCRWGFNLYVAGELGDVMEKGADMTVDKAVEALENTGAGLSWLGGVLPMAGKIFAKAGEGAANYYLCRRLGLQAIDAFAPKLPSMP